MKYESYFRSIKTFFREILRTDSLDEMQIILVNKSNYFYKIISFQPRKIFTKKILVLGWPIIQQYKFFFRSEKSSDFLNILLKMVQLVN